MRKPRERERERRRGREDDVISDDGGYSAPPPLPPPPALRPPTEVICKVFSQLDCVDLLTCSLVCKQWYRDSSKYSPILMKQNQNHCQCYWYRKAAMVQRFVGAERGMEE